MKKVIKILGIIGAVVLVLVIVLVAKIIIDNRIQAKDQKLMVKSDDELIGTHLYIERDNENSVDVNWYQPESENANPLVINLHGGTFVAGDADTLDTQSDRISKEWNVNIATVNYSLLKDDITREDVIKEITDTVKYFIANAEKYNINPDEIYIMGYSAGGYYAMASTLELHKNGIDIKGQILCYAFISNILDQYNALTIEQKKTMPKALFILADNDPLSDASLDYEKVLSENGVITDSKKFDGTTHGFIEENNPEYEKLNKKNRTSKSPEQEKSAREAEDYIGNWIEHK